MRGTEGGKIAVGGRQHDNVGGGLPEIAGDVAVVNTAAIVELEMHACFRPLLQILPSLSRQRAADRLAVEPLEADHHQMLGLLHVRTGE